MKIVGRRYSTAEPLEIEFVGPRIAAVRKARVDGSDYGRLPWLAPGFVDLQVNGYRGLDFSSEALTVDDVLKLARSLADTGVTHFLATVITQSPEVMLHAVRTIARACRESPAEARTIAGIHVEGPYISPDDGPRGAHLRQFVRPPNWEEFSRLQDAAEGRIRLITLSPEHPQAPAFIRQADAAGVLISIGHTQATSEQIAAAVDAGASLSTHLGNGAHALLPRHPNYLWDQLADDRLMAGFIADGWHLPPATLKAMVRAKSPGRSFLVSDLTAHAGLPPGRYTSGLGDVEVLDDGRLVVAGQRQYLAGAAAPIGVGIANLMRHADLDRAVAVELASTRPGMLLGLPRDALHVGSIADLVVFDLPGADGHGPLGELAIRQTIVAGEVWFDTSMQR